MIEFLTVSSVNDDNRKRDVFPGSRGQSVRGAQAHEPWGHYFYSNTLVYCRAQADASDVNEFTSLRYLMYVQKFHII